MDQHDIAPSGRLAGKVAVVTGAMQGPGEAIVRRFAVDRVMGLVPSGRNRDRGEGCRATADPGLPTGANLAFDQTVRGVSDKLLPVPA